MLCQDEPSRSVWVILASARRVFDWRKLVFPLHLQQSSSLGQGEGIEDEQLQLDSLQQTAHVYGRQAGMVYRADDSPLCCLLNSQQCNQGVTIQGKWSTMMAIGNRSLAAQCSSDSACRVFTSTWLIAKNLAKGWAAACNSTSGLHGVQSSPGCSGQPLVGSACLWSCRFEAASCLGNVSGARPLTATLTGPSLDGIVL